MTDLNKMLLEQGAIGADADDFLNSPLGRVVLAQAHDEAREALSKLRTVLPWRRRKIQELQNIVWRAEAFEGWLRRTVAIGQQALAEYDRRSDHPNEENNE
jgi:hypothetical protein